MAAFGHQQGEVDAGFGEVRQGGVAQLVQRPARLADLQRAVLEQVGGSFVGEAATAGDRVIGLPVVMEQKRTLSPSLSADPRAGSRC